MKKAYAAYHRDEEIRLNSSSGGVFHGLARQVLKEGGVVFGAAFDENFHVVYRGVEQEEELQKLRGAKYVFPRIGDTYSRIREYLEEGRKVLFTGLPCHAAGLLRFLGKPEKNLICVDFICHGAPEEIVWDAYRNYVEKKTGKLAAVQMRDKKKGWSCYQVVFRGENGSSCRRYSEEDPYMQGFIGDKYLRASCYQCPCKGTERKTDLTLGDYWGGSALHPDMNDDKGISLVLAHTEVGMQIFSQIKKDLVWSETDLSYAVSRNPSLIHTAEKPEEREKILSGIRQGESFEKAVLPDLRTSFTKAAEKKCRRIGRLWKRKIQNIGKYK